MVARMVELRKGKMDRGGLPRRAEEEQLLRYHAGGHGQGRRPAGGATYSTADTVRPALQLVKTKPGNSIVSSCFILVRPSATGDNDVLAMADCAINIKPNEDELVEIASETVACAKIFGVDPKVASELLHLRLRQGRGRGQDAQRLREGQGCYA